MSTSSSVQLFAASGRNPPEVFYWKLNACNRFPQSTGLLVLIHVYVQVWTICIKGIITSDVSSKHGPGHQAVKTFGRTPDGHSMAIVAHRILCSCWCAHGMSRSCAGRWVYLSANLNLLGHQLSSFQISDFIMDTRGDPDVWGLFYPISWVKYAADLTYLVLRFVICLERSDIIYIRLQLLDMVSAYVHGSINIRVAVLLGSDAESPMQLKPLPRARRTTFKLSHSSWTLKTSYLFFSVLNYTPHAEIFHYKG
jgi:hypothetical protein